MRYHDESLSHRCACGRYTSCEEGYGYIHIEDLEHPLSGVYCNEMCAVKAVNKYYGEEG